MWTIFAPPAPPGSTSPSLPIWQNVLFKKQTKTPSSSICASHILWTRHVTFRWRTDLLKGASLKGTDSSSPSSYQLTVVPQLRVGTDAQLSFPCWKFCLCLRSTFARHSLCIRWNKMKNYKNWSVDYLLMSNYKSISRNKLFYVYIYWLI